MDAERWKKIRDVLEAALEAPVEARSSLIRSRCGDDSALEAEVHKLLESHEEADGFLEPSRSGSPSYLSLAFASHLSPGELVGSYRISSELGRGGMSEVLLACRNDGQFAQEVAIKVAHLRLGSEDEINRFRQERQILANLQHENIARLLDGGTTADGRPYLVMEYVSGLPIDRYCDENRCSVDQRLRLFLKVCSAVQLAHQNLIVHRDLKPANILVAPPGVPKLLDFGIAKLLEPDQSSFTIAATRTGLLAMTPECASPEQIRGERITTASDIYSLGVLLYYLLTGESPYRLENRAFKEVADAICDQEPLMPSQAVLRSADPSFFEKCRFKNISKLAQRLSGDLDNIVLCALQKSPSHRYASVEQFADDIRRELTGFPVTARAHTFAYRSFKFLRRHWMGATAIAALVLLLAGLAGQSFRVRSALRQVTEERRQARDYLAKQYWSGAHGALREEDWLRAAHNFSKFSSMEDRPREAVHSAKFNIQAYIGNIALRDVLSHDSELRRTFFSSDGKMIAAEAPNSFSLWDAKDGSLAASLREENLEVSHFNYSGGKFLTWSRDEDVKIWSVESGPSLTHRLHHKGVLGATFKADSDFVLTWGKDGFARLWSAKDGALLDLELDHGPDLGFADFCENSRAIITLGRGRVKLWSELEASPEATWQISRPSFLLCASVEGRSLVLGLSMSLPSRQVSQLPTRMLRLWSVESGSAKEIRLPLEVSRISFSSMVGWAAGGSRFWVLDKKSSSLRLFDSRDGSLVESLALRSSPLLPVSNVGQRLLLVSSGEELMSLRSKDLARLTPSIRGRYSFTHMGMSLDDRFIVTGSRNGTARIWGRKSGSPVTAALKIAGRVESASLSADQQAVMVWGEPYSEVRLWSVDLEFPLSASMKHELYSRHPRIGAGFSVKNQRIVTWRKDGPVRIWNLAGEPVETDESLQEFRISDALLSPDRSLILAWNRVGFRIWRSSDGSPVMPEIESEAVFGGAEFGLDDHHFLSLGSDRIMRIWLLTKDSALPVFSMSYEEDTRGLTISRDKNLVLTWADNRGENKPPSETHFRVWDVRGGSAAIVEKAHIKVSEGDLPPSSHSLGFRFVGALILPDNRSAVIWGGVGEVGVWRFEENTITFLDLKGQASPAGRQSSTFSGVKPAAAPSEFLTTRDNAVQLWSTETLSSRLPAMRHAGAVHDVVLSPDERHILSRSDDNTVRLWKLSDGSMVSRPMTHDSKVRGAIFSADGHRILSWVEDGTLHLWRAKDCTRLGRVLKHGSAVVGAEFSSDGRFVLSWSNDGAVRLWDLSVDYDFPVERSSLMVEALTGTRLDDVGVVVPIASEEWRRVRAQYLRVAQEHSEVCAFPHANAYQQNRM